MVNLAQKSLISSMKTKAIFISLVFSLWISAALAVDPVIVTVGTNSVPINKTLSVSFKISDARVKGFQFTSNGKDFDIVASSSSSSIQMINGNISQRKTLSYVLKPLRVGTILIPAVSYTLGGQAYQTQPYQVTVTAAASQQPQSRNPAAQRQAADNIDPTAQTTSMNYRPYVNQQFIIKTKIYHRGNLRNISFENLLVDHLNIKRIDQAKEYTEVKDGLEYMVYEVDYIAFALKSGPLVIPSYDINTIIIREKARPAGRMTAAAFMNYFFEEVKIPIKVPAITINVQALPEGAPEDFSGYVGTLAVNHQADKLNISSGDAVTIKTNVYGNGNPKNLQFDFFEESKLYSIYKDKENLNKEINKDYEYFGLNATAAIIPERKSGRMTIRTKPLISFNPYTKKYEEHGADQFDIFVKPGAQELDENGNLMTQEDSPVAPAVKEEFKKELSLFSINEILGYKSWKNFETDYLLIFLVLLNFAYCTRYTLRRVQLPSINNDKVDYKELQNRIKNAKDLEDISSLIKDLEKDLSDKDELKTKFQDFTNETDKYNYGFMSGFDESKLQELKAQAINLVKEVKNNA